MLCLIYTHDARGRAAPEGECVYIRQSTSAWDITNMLHFPVLERLPNLSKVSLVVFIIKGARCDYGVKLSVVGL